MRSWAFRSSGPRVNRPNVQFMQGGAVDVPSHVGFTAIKAEASSGRMVSVADEIEELQAKLALLEKYLNGRVAVGEYSHGG